MKILLTFILLSFGLNSYAQESENSVTFQKMVKVDRPGEYWVHDIHLQSDGGIYRIKNSELNKGRICRDLGFRKAGGSRVEFDEESIVVSLKGHLNVKKVQEAETSYIFNLNCIK